MFPPPPTLFILQSLSCLGLAWNRAVVCRDASDRRSDSEEDTISLQKIKESIWWARFSDRDYEEKNTKTLRESIELSELLHVLGAAQDDFGTLSAEDAASLRLTPGTRNQSITTLTLRWTRVGTWWCICATLLIRDTRPCRLPRCPLPAASGLHAALDSPK